MIVRHEIVRQKMRVYIWEEREFVASIIFLNLVAPFNLLAYVLTTLSYEADSPSIAETCFGDRNRNRQE